MTMSHARRQTDAEFTASCGLTNDEEGKRAALALRQQLADYGRVDVGTICADTKVIDTGLLHPADSIDLVEFTIVMEELMGVRLDEDDIQPIVAAGAEEMEIRSWIQVVLQIRQRKKSLQ